MGPRLPLHPETGGVRPDHAGDPPPGRRPPRRLGHPDTLRERLTPHQHDLLATYEATILPAALEWRTVDAPSLLHGAALAGEGFFNKFDSAEERAFRAQIRALLDSMPLPLVTGAAEFRNDCLRELREARKAGLLLGSLNPDEMRRTLAAHAAQPALIEADRAALSGMGATLKQAGHPNLARLVSHPVQPDQALLLLQRDIQTARAEAHQARAETLATVKEELHQFASRMTAEVGQVGSGVQQQLQHVGAVVGAVQGSLGKLGEVTQRVFDVGRDIAGLEQLLKSPKVRGGVGETLLENLLAQMLPREQYLLQHAFATGDRVDAAVRIGERVVPIDAKFPLENFRRVLEEPDEDRRPALRRAFLRDVKNRVDEIAKKYILPDEGTFDFALMYIPAENIYYEIIVKEDGEEEPPAAYALGRRVVPVSPNTFYAYLRVIVMGLRGLRIERDAQEIQARLGRLRGDLEKFRDAFDVVGKHLSNARNKYDDAAAGLGRLEGKLEGIERHGEQEPLPGIGS